MYFLGIDIGSTFLKCALLSPSDHSISHARTVPSPERRPAEKAGYFAYDAAQYVRIISALIEEAVEICGGDLGVVISTQMHGFVVDGTYISWQDSRCLEPMEGGESYLDYMKKRVSPEEMRGCGVYCKPSLGVCNLFAMLHGEGRLNRELEVFTLGSYVLCSMTGVNRCHITNAAPLGFADIERRIWREDLFARFGMSALRLPQIVREDYAPCGQCIVKGRTATFYPDYGDQQVSVLGSGAARDDAVINIATAAQLIAFSDMPEYGDYEVRPYFDGKYIKVLSNMPGGRSLQVLAEFIRDVGRKVYDCDADDREVFDRIGALSPRDAQQLTMDMSFYPTYDRFDGGGIYHITPDNLTVGTLFAAAYEAMAGEYRTGLRRLLHEGPRRVVCIGGAAQKNAGLRAKIEKALGCPCRLPENMDEVLTGLLHIAEAAYFGQKEKGVV